MRNIKPPDSNRRVFIGKYVLESLSFGMYDHPLMAIREYVQNSADAIDEMASRDSRRLHNEALIDITLDGWERSIVIKDTGTGIVSGKAYGVLHDLGRSEKRSAKSRGFRGIGRLGGLGYCEELRFITKAKGDETVSIATWDCERLRALVTEKGNSLDALGVVHKVTEFKQERYLGEIHDHFFAVEMKKVRSSRDMLLHVPSVRDYLSQVAPAGFSPSGFRFGNEIDAQLRRRVASYQTYNIRVNGEDIYRPYRDSVRVAGDSVTGIESIRFVDLHDDESVLLAIGWIGEHGLLGTVQPSTLVDGIRVRCGNMMVGDKDILSEFFREKRFSNYMVGEIHVVDGRLVPNSRRDGFEDNPTRDDFYSCFAGEIGVPYSIKIRERSKSRSLARHLEDRRTLLEMAERLIARGYLAEMQKQEVSKRLAELNKNGHGMATKKSVNDLIRAVSSSRHALDKHDGLHTDGSLAICKGIFETIYRETSNKAEAEVLLQKLLDSFVSMDQVKG